MSLKLIHTYNNRCLNEIVRTYDNGDQSVYYEELDILNVTGENIGKGVSHFLDWIDQPLEYSNRLLLGDYGTGKTYFCWKLERDIAWKYVRGQCQRVPILIQLSDFKGKIDDIKEVILLSLKNRYNFVMNDYREIDVANKAGHLLFIFDGFDELTARIDKQVIRSNLQQINQIVYPKSKIVITCRTEYFHSVDQIREELMIISRKGPQGSFFDIYTLNYLNEQKKKNIIKKRAYEKYPELYIMIRNEGNLNELASRPLFLDKILSTIQFVDKKKIKAVNMAKLYEIYINTYLEDQHEETRSIIPGKHAVKILTAIAKKMHLKQTNTIMADDLQQLLENHFASVLNELNVDGQKLCDSIVTHTFLDGSKEKGYKFNHPSFQYYFRAKSIYKALLSNDRAFLKVDFIGAETILFTKDMLHLKDKQRLLSWLQDKDINIQKYSTILLGFIEENCLVDIEEKLNHKERYVITKKLLKIISEKKNSDDPSRLHLVKHAKLSVSLLMDERYKDCVIEIVKFDTDYTHRWYALFSIKKIISVKEDLINYFYDVVKYVLAHESNPEIKRLAEQILESMIKHRKK